MKKEVIVILVILVLLVSGCDALNMICEGDECEPSAKEDQKTLEPFIVEETRPTEPEKPS